MSRSPDDRPDPVEVVERFLKPYKSVLTPEVLSDDIVDALRSRGLLPEGQKESVNPSCEPLEGEAERLREELDELRHAVDRFLTDADYTVSASVEEELLAALSPAPETEEEG